MTKEWLELQESELSRSCSCLAADLDRVIKNRYLKVLTTKNPYDYYVHGGEMEGVQYEMVREFVGQLNRKCIKEGELKIARTMTTIFTPE
ncbi:MAG: hypothetical protein A2428_06420 [Bdellovibrionales bacterium RIFOXYC1_FULL_54_43]|nr:MAG: hypothetical protein A2428_06420 [Bdellovibrionales bacterium RIFOXYC1_FULL_54_43]OFZ80080.1 MAG: hypothetical protein A2603_17335 [Bdellovibrionales bacterium RIFOXYD1_FULL_55_31]